MFKHISISLICIILLGALLRLPILANQSIAFDESFSLVVGQADWPLLFQAILSDGVHPPLFYVIHKIALSLWGISEFGQRFLAAGFSIVSIALIYRAATIIFKRNVGLIAALLLTLNPLHIWFAQEARMYSLFGALTILSMTFFWLAIRTNRNRYWISLAIVNSIIFLLHYFGSLVPIIQLAFIIVTFQRNYRSLRPWVAVQAIAFGPLLPWLAATALRPAQTFGVGFLVRPTPLDVSLTYWNLLLGSRNLPALLIIFTLIVGGVGLVMVFRPIAPHRFRPKQARYLVILWVLLPPLMVWLISQRRSFYADRYLSFIIPGLMLLLAFGVSRVKKPHWRTLLLGSLVVLSSYGLVATQRDPIFRKDDWRGVAAYITRHEQSEDVILLYSTHIKFPFDYYYDSRLPQKPISLNLENYPLEPLVEGHRRAWVVYPYTRRPTHYPMQPLMPDGYWDEDPERNPLLGEWLTTHTEHVVDYHHFQGIEIWLVDLTAETEVINDP